ncbi:hypothetical protein Tco_0882860 [Tanacetum coccineum]
MSTSNQQTLAESRALDIPLILEKGNYVPWASRFMRKMIPDPDNTAENIPEPINKMTDINKSQYFADIKVMNYLLQGIPNDIYNYVDACKDAKTMWERIFMNELDKFIAVEGESLTSMYERLTTLINLYDHLSRFEPHVNASKVKKAARNHDPLALVANSHVHSSRSHASPSYSHSSQPYYVTHPSSVLDYEEDYQEDAQEDKLTTAVMLLARAITQRYSTPTNNRLRTSSNTRNQVVIQDGRVDIQSKNIGYAGNDNRNAGRQNKNQAANAGNGMVQ